MRSPNRDDSWPDIQPAPRLEDELARTLAAITTHRWRAVLNYRRSKKPAARKGEPWPVTSDAARIAAHVRAGGNLGLITDEKTGLAVLDADYLLPMADMIEALGQPAACWVETGRARLHYYVEWIDDLPAQLSWRDEPIGQIQRGPGQQQILCPPSTHPSTGLRYRWLVDPTIQPIEPLPAEWRAYLRALTYDARYGSRYR